MAQKFNLENVLLIGPSKFPSLNFAEVTVFTVYSFSLGEHVNLTLTMVPDIDLIRETGNTCRMQLHSLAMIRSMSHGSNPKQERGRRGGWGGRDRLD